MAGAMVTITLDPARMADARAALDRLFSAGLQQVSYEIGSLVEDQTKRRIADDKTAPDGTPWADWSEDYAATRKAGVHALLVGRGDLRDSIQNYTSGDTIRVGTNLVYGAIHQFGSNGAEGGIPARPWLGLSREDEREITDLVIGRLEDLLQ
jgi:phage virion morphogenesis protein